MEYKPGGCCPKVDKQQENIYAEYLRTGKVGNLLPKTDQQAYNISFMLGLRQVRSEENANAQRRSSEETRSNNGESQGR